MLRLLRLRQRAVVARIIAAAATLVASPTHGLSLQTALARASAKPPAPSAGVSVAIADLAVGSPLVFGFNAGQPLTIASVSKIFSTAATLARLGKDYQFKTTLYRNGEVVDGLLRGSLLVVGGGDPNLSGRFYDRDINAVFDRWADGLRTAGVTRISGDLLLNSSFFDDQYRGPGWPPGQEARWYQAPIAGLSFNDNCVAVSVEPATKSGSAARVWVDPPTRFVQLVGRVRTAGPRRAARVAVGRRYGSSVVTVAGLVPSRSGPWSTVIAIDDPPMYFGTVLRERLEAQGLKIDGNVVRSSQAPDASWARVATTTSDLLPSIAVANKRSQSFYAEQIFKTLAAEKGKAGTWDEALAIEREFLVSLNLDASRYDLHDGSGLDPRNRVATLDIVHFLRALSASAIAADWTSTLAVSGEPDGSLRHRLRDHGLAGKIQAKTGSLDRVNSLAGYVTAVSGKTYAFAIVLNGKRVDDGSGHAYEDRIIRALALNG